MHFPYISRLDDVYIQISLNRKSTQPSVVEMKKLKDFLNLESKTFFDKVGHASNARKTITSLS